MSSWMYLVLYFFFSFSSFSFILSSESLLFGILRQQQHSGISLFFSFSYSMTWDGMGYDDTIRYFTILIDTPFFFSMYARLDSSIGIWWSCTVCVL